MRTKTATPKARARRPRDVKPEPTAKGAPATAGRPPARVLAVPTLRAERLYGHASPDRMHSAPVRKIRPKGRLAPS